MGVVRCAAGAIALASCYSTAGEMPCSVACDFNGARSCPGELTCQNDGLCHATGQECLDGYARAVLADHPIAYWRLDEPLHATTAVDLMRLVDGKYVGNCTAGEPGALTTNAAVRFDGMTCWVELDDVPQLRFASNLPYTIEAWIDPDMAAGYRHVFTREARPGAGPMDGYALLMKDPQTVQAERVVNSMNGYLEAGIAPGFRHVAAVYDGQDLYLYVDGLGAGVVAQMPMNIFPSREFIGAAGTSSNLFQGVLDEIAIYDKPLMPPQLQNHIAARD